jgi:hypothetical protein
LSEDESSNGKQKNKNVKAESAKIDRFDFSKTIIGLKSFAVFWSLA